MFIFCEHCLLYEEALPAPWNPHCLIFWLQFSNNSQYIIFYLKSKSCSIKNYKKFFITTYSHSLSKFDAPFQSSPHLMWFFPLVFTVIRKFEIWFKYELTNDGLLKVIHCTLIWKMTQIKRGVFEILLRVENSSQHYNLSLKANLIII